MSYGRAGFVTLRGEDCTGPKSVNPAPLPPSSPLQASWLTALEINPFHAGALHCMVQTPALGQQASVEVGGEASHRFFNMFWVNRTAEADGNCRGGGGGGGGHHKLFSDILQSFVTWQNRCRPSCGTMPWCPSESSLGPYRPSP